ncbi:Alpha/Beta hydrolase protein [Irpex rosettiformis]|uniref:Alpha/Beta hydrolase protein n=1 Tax=Irpex rosettiformis TaxID=378272 RepID=A0ACB8TYR2_9APHY|nr:Alpha/Beta hydrolase protein [Irpex rosettiformis]
MSLVSLVGRVYRDTLLSRYQEYRQVPRRSRRPKKIGVDSALPANFTGCAWDVKARFCTAQDRMNPTQHHNSASLDRGTRVLIYVGENDWMCNWVANERTSLALEWHGSIAFSKEPLRSWIHKGYVAGQTRSVGALTYATISGAGHVAPY